MKVPIFTTWLSEFSETVRRAFCNHTRRTERALPPKSMRKSPHPSSSCSLCCLVGPFLPPTSSMLSRFSRQTDRQMDEYPIPKLHKNHNNQSLPDGSVGKESTCDAEDTGDAGSIPGLGRSPGGGNDNPLQDSCLRNPMDRGAWQTTAQRVAKSQT